jgi:hypothetical protein
MTPDGALARSRFPRALDLGLRRPPMWVSICQHANRFSLPSELKIVGRSGPHRDRLADDVSRGGGPFTAFWRIATSSCRS